MAKRRTKQPQFRRTPPPCVYCGDLSETEDHVFPECLFGDRHIPKYVKQRACRQCNERKAKLDSYVRDWIAADMRFHAHPVVRDNFGGPVSRAFSRKQTPIRHGITSISDQIVDIITPSGLFVGTAFPVTLRTDEIDEWLRFVVQGLTSYHLKVILPPTFSHRILRVDDQEFMRQVEILAQHGEYQGPFRLGGDVAIWSYLGVSAETCIWPILLYDRVPFLVAVLTSDQIAELEMRKSKTQTPP